MKTCIELVNSIFLFRIRDLAVVVVLALAFSSRGQAQIGVTADSVSEFSGTQGQYNWYYGYYDGDGSLPYSNEDFELFPKFDGSEWYIQRDWQGSPWYWTALWDRGGHPNGSITSGGSESKEHWAVRRWISEATGPITITGRLAKTYTIAGDGITGYILIDGQVVWSQHIAYNDAVGVNYSIVVDVNVGSLVDFAIAPNTSDWADGSEFTAVICHTLRVLSPNGGEMWASETTQDIQWETYCDADIAEVKIEYSDSNGKSWNLVDSNTTNDGAYEWIVPQVASPECLVRISDVNDPNIYDMSDDVFTISQCLGPVPGDLNNDCYTNGKDLAILAAHWLHCGNPLDPACGIVAYWRFDEDSGTTAYDMINDNHGTLHNFDWTVNSGWTSGKIGGSLSFDGVDDYVSVSPISALAGDNLTAQAWINMDELAGEWNPVLTQHDLSNYGYYFYVANYMPKFYVFASSGFAQVTSPEIIKKEQWYHVAGTNDGLNLKLYVDGQLKITAPSVGMTGTNYNAYIGCEISTPLYYNGLIDEVRIYNRALTGTEIEYLYNAR